LIIYGRAVGAYLNIGGGRANCIELVGQETLKQGQWHHLAMTYDGAVLKLFGDGMLLGSNDVNKPRVPGKAGLTIGNRQDRFRGCNFRGRLDEVRIYDRALSLEEIKIHSQRSAALDPKEKALVLSWP
jgi:hypothetical protein